jgi:hypothetical protein
MSKIRPTATEFSGNARNILWKLEHLINNGQWQEYNKKLDSLAKKHGDDPNLVQMVENLKVKNKRDFQEKHKKAGNDDK